MKKRDPILKMRKLFGILSASLFILSCAEERLNMPGLQQVRARHDKIIDSLNQQLIQSPLNRKLLVEFGKACLSKSGFERELSWTGEWGTLVHPKLAESPLVTALPHIESALQVDTTSADLYALLGRTYLELWRIKQFTYFFDLHPHYHKAARALSKALELDSLHVNAMVDWARLVPLDRRRLSQSDGLAKAENLTRKAIQLDPENGMTYFRYGQVLTHLSDGPRSSSAESDELYAKAIKAYRKAIKLGVDDAGAYVELANFFEETGVSVSFNFKTFNKTFGFVPGFIKGFFLAGLRVLEMRGDEKAARLASKALLLNPLYPAALMVQANSYEEVGKREKAVDYFLKATQLNPAVQGSYYLTKESFLKEVISIDPQSYVAYARLGELLLNAKKGAPIAYIKKALEIRPDYSKGWLLLGRAYGEQKLIAKADSAYQKVLSLPWDNPLYEMRQFYADQKKFDKVISIVYREIAEGLTDSSWGFWTLGDIFEGYGELDRAKVYYARGMKISVMRERPDMASILAGRLADVYGKEKNFDKAISTLRNVLRLAILDKSTESNIYRQMGSVYSVKGDSRKAIEFFERAISVRSDFWLIHYDLGKELLKKGENTKALEHFQRAAEHGITAAGDSVQSLLKRK